MFGQVSEFHNPEGSGPDKAVVEALVWIQQPHQLPAGMLQMNHVVFKY